MSHVLIVDDDAVSRLVLRHMLERQDHTVSEADGVDTALAMFSTTAESFDLIICDYVMPDRNGLDLLESRPDSGVPFVLLTGELNEADLDDGRVSDVSAYLTKPVASDELERVVSEHLRGNMSECHTQTAH